MHVNPQNGSSVRFFITYLIYAFANIIRFLKKCYGDVIKIGKVKSNKLVLLGKSATTSGDGNPVTIKINDITINCPTEQFISCSALKTDWNRFWIE